MLTYGSGYTLDDVDHAKAFIILMSLRMANRQSWLMMGLNANEATSVGEHNARLLDQAEKEILYELSLKWPNLWEKFDPDNVEDYIKSLPGRPKRC